MTLWKTLGLLWKLFTRLKYNIILRYATGQLHYHHTVTSYYVYIYCIYIPYFWWYILILREWGENSGKRSQYYIIYKYVCARTAYTFTFSWWRLYTKEIVFTCMQYIFDKIIKYFYIYKYCTNLYMYYHVYQQPVTTHINLKKKLPPMYVCKFPNMIFFNGVLTNCLKN